uniref:Sulfotransferase family protein n=1 Tax=Fundidesulfovibrio putealis TaxID=270496 RepID=A0A7C3W8U9_9BACT
MNIHAALDAYMPRAHQAYYICVSARHGYVYVTTPKCACTALLALLQRLELDDPAYRPSVEQAHDRLKSPLFTPEAVDFPAMLEDGRVLKFTFVRNPFTRILSAYLSKIVGRKEQRAIVNLLLGLPSADMDTHISFGQFVEAVAGQEAFAMDGHWRPLSCQTYAYDFPYDFIGRFEHFARDLETLNGLLGGKLAPYYAPDTYHPTNAAGLLHRHYTPEIADRVLALYRHDFVNFGYDTDWRALCWEEARRSALRFPGVPG